MMEICNICNIFPAIGTCPRCQRAYCPDDIQQEYPFILCLDCAQQDPAYLRSGGRWIAQNTWLDFNTNQFFNSANILRIKPFTDTLEIWQWLEAEFKKDGIDLWTMYENNALEYNNTVLAALCRLRKLGYFSVQDTWAGAVKMLENGDKESTLKILNDLLCFDPNHPNALLMRGDIYKEAQKYHEAIADFSHVINSYPDYPQAYYRRATVYLFDLKDYEQAYKDLVILEKYGPDPISSYFLGIIHARRLIVLGEKDASIDALECLNRALSLSKDMTDVYPLRGYVNLISGDDEAAVSDFRIAEERCNYDYFDIEWII